MNELCQRNTDSPSDEILSTLHEADDVEVPLRLFQPKRIEKKGEENGWKLML